MGTRLRRERGDHGQAVPLAAAMVGLAVIALMALAPVGRALAARAQARTAADAAALAAAAEGPAAARSMARANRAVLLDIDERDGEVVVRVEVEGVAARARARRVAAAGSPAGGERAGLSPAMLGALGRADARLGYPVPVVSGLRTRAEQQALWDRRHTNRYPVARPGTSDHERGLAVDVPAGAARAVAAVAPSAGLCRPLPRTDPVHFVVCGT